MTVSLHPDADAEFAGAVTYYSEISAELGIRFYHEMERLLFEVAANPERFRKFDPPARRHFSSDFPYAIIFVEKADHIRVVAIMHMHRQPGYWRKRLG